MPGSSLLTCDVTLLLLDVSVNLVQSEGKEHPSADVKGVTRFNEEGKPEGLTVGFLEPEGNACSEERADKEVVSHFDLSSIRVGIVAHFGVDLPGYD